MRITLWLVIGLVLFGGVSNMLLATGVYDVSYTDRISYAIWWWRISNNWPKGAAQSEDNPIGGYNLVIHRWTTDFEFYSDSTLYCAVGLGFKHPCYLFSLIFQSAIWVIYGMELYALHKQVVIAWIFPGGDLKQIILQFLKHPVETIWLTLIACYVCMLVKLS